MSLQEIWNSPIGEKFNLITSHKKIKVQNKSLEVSNYDSLVLCMLVASYNKFGPRAWCCMCLQSHTINPT
jgi:hypothetical protein